MSRDSLIPALQSDALVREIERQLAVENSELAEGAARDARNILAQARASARAQVHAAIDKLREDGARRLMRARAQREAEQYARTQREAARAVREALPLLREALAARWRDPQSRQRWADAVARLCADRLPPGDWLVEHPGNWDADEQQRFAAAVGSEVKPSFQAADIASGLRIGADGARLDATAQGLLADADAIAAQLMNEIGAAP
jgi:hypothetical protein